MCAIGGPPRVASAAVEGKIHRRKTTRDFDDDKHSVGVFLGIHFVSYERYQRSHSSRRSSQGTTQLKKILEVMQRKRADIRKDSDPTELSKMMDVVQTWGDQFFLKGDLDDAVLCYKEAREISCAWLGESHQSTASLLEKVCALYFMKGSISQLKHLLRKNLKIKEDRCGWRHEKTSLAYQRLGDAYRLEGDFDSALEFYTTALTIRWLLRDLGQTDLVQLLQRFGDVYFAKGNYRRAWSTYAEISRLQHDGLKGRCSATTIHKMGLLLNACGHSRESTKLLEEAVNRRKREEEEQKVSFFFDESGSVEVEICDQERGHHDAPNLTILDACFDQMSTSDMVKNNSSANKVCEASSLCTIGGELTVEEKEIISAYGVDCGLRTKYVDQKGKKVRFSSPLITSVRSVPYPGADEIKSLFYSIADINSFRKDKHTWRYCRALAAKLDRIGITEFTRGNYSDALEALTHGLRIKTEVLGDEHMSASTTLLKIGDIYCKQLLLDKALNAYEAALSLQKRDLGEHNIFLVSTLNKIGRLYQKDGQNVIAIAVFEEVLGLREQHLGCDHLFVAMTHDCIGELYLKEGEPTSALSHFSCSLGIKKQQLGGEHKDLAPALGRLAKALKALGEKSEVGKCSLHAQDIVKQRSKRHQDIEASLASSVISDEAVGRVLIEF